MKKAGLALILAVWCLAGGLPPAAAHQDSTSFLKPAEGVARPEGYALVRSEMRAWNLGGARERLAEFRKKAPGLPSWEALDGAIAYLEGDYTKSIERLNEALRKRPGDREWLELRLHVRQSQAAVEGFQSHRTAHFEIWYDAKVDIILLPYLSDALERAYEVLGKELGVKPERHVRVEVFSDPDRFHKASTLSRRDIEEKGAVGVSKFNKLMILSPGALLSGYRWLDTAAHEYVHYLIVLATQNLAPIWLHEGIAKYLETRWRASNLPYLTPGEEVLLSGAREQDGYVPFETMEPSLIYLETPEQVQLAYAEAASAVDFIRRRVGPGAVGRLLRAIRDGGAEKEKKTAVGKRKIPAPAPKKEEGAGAGVRMSSLVELEASGPEQSAAQGLRTLLGVDLAGFQKIWKKDLEKRPLRVRPGARVRKYKLKPTGPVDENTSDLAALKSAVARRRMRLADRLLLSGRLRAARVEYRRALRDEAHSLVLLNRLARVELQLGAYREAVPLLRQAHELDPDYGATYVHQGLAFEMAGNLKAARTAWEQAIQINPFDPLPHSQLSALYARAGEKEKAERERVTAHALRGQ